MVPLWWDAGTLDDLRAWKTECLLQSAGADQPFLASLIPARAAKTFSRHTLRKRYSTYHALQGWGFIDGCVDIAHSCHLATGVRQNAGRLCSTLPFPVRSRSDKRRIRSNEVTVVSQRLIVGGRAVSLELPRGSPVQARPDKTGRSDEPAVLLAASIIAGIFLARETGARQ